MAFLQPRNLRSRNDIPARLQTVARCLGDLLPDEVTVWLERTSEGERRALRQEFEQQKIEGLDDDGQSYLVVLDPAAGIIVLEAPSRIRVRRTSGRRDSIDRDRIRELTEQRVDELRLRLEARSVQSMPVKVALALPDVAVAAAGGLWADVPVIFADDFTAEALRPALQEIVGGSRRATRPEEESAARAEESAARPEEESAARAAVNPAIVIRGTQGRLFARPEDQADDQEILRTLDRRQERLAHTLGPGYRLIRGVAGSGKTLVLTYRAQHISLHLPEWRILLLCFNTALSQALEHHIGKRPNVSVQTLDALARGVLKSTGRLPGDSSRPDFDQRRRDALAAVSEIDEAELFDMVLVDEAQDLDTTGLDLAWAMLKPGRTHFVMALDGAQMLYRRRMAWNPPSMTARGRTTVLDVNYRNTREVLDLGQHLLAGIGSGSSDDRSPDDLDVLVQPDKAVRIGMPPTCLACSDLPREAEAIAARVAELRSRGVRPEQMVVLLGTEQLRHDVMRLVPDAFDTKAGRNRYKIFDVAGKVRVATLGLLKGLEFPHVIIGGANAISVHARDEQPQQEQQRRLLYVAVTRATETLTITYSGTGIMSEMEQVRKMGP